MNVRDFLQPGDILLYRPENIFGWIIAIKTWHAISHCEGYLGMNYSVASRNGIGVNIYPLRLERLTRIIRPVPSINLDDAMAWFETVRGQKYDWWGLLRFFSWKPGRPHDRMACSPFLTRWLRHGGCEPFQPDEDADGIAPFEFLTVRGWDDYIVNDGLVTPTHCGREEGGDVRNGSCIL